MLRRKYRDERTRKKNIKRAEERAARLKHAKEERTLKALKEDLAPKPPPFKEGELKDEGV